MGLFRPLVKSWCFLRIVWIRWAGLSKPKPSLSKSGDTHMRYKIRKRRHSRRITMYIKGLVILYQAKFNRISSLCLRYLSWTCPWSYPCLQAWSHSLDAYKGNFWHPSAFDRLRQSQLPTICHEKSVTGERKRIPSQHLDKFKEMAMFWIAGIYKIYLSLPPPTEQFEVSKRILVQHFRSQLILISK
jgi:hypothetical protein